MIRRSAGWNSLKNTFRSRSGKALPLSCSVGDEATTTTAVSGASFTTNTICRGAESYWGMNNLLRRRRRSFYVPSALSLHHQVNLAAGLRHQSSAITTPTVSEHLTPRKVPYFPLAAQAAFSTLTLTEQLYAHHMSRASWAGLYSCAKQVSHESPKLLQGFFELFHHNTVEQLSAAAVVGQEEEETDSDAPRSRSERVTADEFEQFLEYFALLYSNSGNYLSFGDTKFIPACSRQAFENILKAAPVQVEGKERRELTAAALDSEEERHLLFPSSLLDQIYALTPVSQRCLGYECSAYYSPNVTPGEIAAIDEWMVDKRISPVNTRILKGECGVLNLALAAGRKKKLFNGVVQTAKVPVGMKGGGDEVKFLVSTGDQGKEMRAVVASLKEAMQYAANENQRKMLQSYIKHFEEGDVEDHKESQKFWVADKGPVVEANLGFIENYRDPAGVRAEWEGFVAVVNKEESAKYGEMVDKSPSLFIKELPWGADFENEVFTKPDFTALEVISFATSGVPVGICIPNYDDVRKDFGFKNVYLSNVASAMSLTEKVNHLSDVDWTLYTEKIKVVYSVGVGIHELLGHGTGKLLSEDEEGTLNFDKEKVINPIDQKLVTSWYKPGETWSTVFKSIANPYEECRAEAVALYLVLQKEMLSIFGQTTEDDCRKTIHLTWLQMVRAGLVGLEFYSPEKSQWLQAHMRARFAILQTLLRGERPLVVITHNPEGQQLIIEIDESRIATDGKKAIGDLLVHLNVFKATADVTRGSAYFEDLTAVDENMLMLRKTVMAVRKPRRQVVQPHTTLVGDAQNSMKVKLIEFDGSPRGVVESFVARHREIPLGEIPLGIGSELGKSPSKR